MIDPTTKAEIDTEEAQAFEDKTQAAYLAKLSTCPTCGHEGPADGIHTCRPVPTEREQTDAKPTTIYLPGGLTTDDLHAQEGQSLPVPTLQDLKAKVEEWMPNATPGDKVREAFRLRDRYVAMNKAYRDGLAQGRDLRQRAAYGLGWIWPSLEELTPRERTFVLGEVRKEVLGDRGAKA